MLSLKSVDEVAYRALQEDLGTGDLSASLVPDNKFSKAKLITRENAILCGTPWFNSVFRQLDQSIQITWKAEDGDEIKKDQKLCVLEGPTRPLLTGERTAMNFIQTLSGTATVTREYAMALYETSTKLLDTRKTIPGLREAQKYAVRCGGGSNHRLGLFDGILLKENHITAAGSIAQAVQDARQRYPDTEVEVEVESLEQLSEAINAGADIILLDNFKPVDLRMAVTMTAGQARLEASGGFSLKDIHAVAKTGVDYISVGALTKHVRAIDLSMRFTE